MTGKLIVAFGACCLLILSCETAGNISKLDESFLQAVYLGRYQEAEEYLAAGANLRAVDRQGKNAVFYAIENGDIERAEYYMKRGVPFRRTVRWGDSEYHALLGYAAGGSVDKDGRLPGLDYALRKFGDPKRLVNLRFTVDSGEEMTLAIRAAQFNNHAAFKTLEPYGPNLALTSSLGRTALDMAYFRQNQEAAAWLVAHKAPMTADWTLINSIIYKNTDIAREALANGARPDTPVNVYGLTPILLSIQNGTTAISKLLLDHGASPRKVKNYHIGPIHVAARQNDLPVLKMLVEHGADLDEEDHYGLHAVTYAKFKGYARVIAYLEGAGAMTVAQVEKLYKDRAIQAAAREEFADTLLKILEVTAKGIHGFNKGYYESKGYTYDIPD
jgi:ankyrin repeat protein